MIFIYFCSIMMEIEVHSTDSLYIHVYQNTQKIIYTLQQEWGREDERRGEGNGGLGRTERETIIPLVGIGLTSFLWSG